MMHLMIANIEQTNSFIGGYANNGNRCGHCVAAPQLFQRPSEKKAPPDMILFAMNTLKKYYFKPNQWLQNIIYARQSPRQQRSEAREAIARVSQVIIDHVDLATLQIVKWNPYTETFRPLRVSEIADLAGISYKRCTRALSTLKSSLYLKLHYRTKITEEGEIRALTAIKFISRQFFLDLGISVSKLTTCMSHAKKRLYKYQQQKEREQERRVTFHMEQGRASNKDQLFKKIPSMKKANNLDIHKTKQWNDRAFALLKTQPGLTREQIIQKIGPPPNH